MELEVLDGQATVEPLLFVIGTDREDFIGLTAMIQIGSIYLGGQIVDLYQRIGIGVEEITVRLEMDDDFLYTFTNASV